MLDAAISQRLNPFTSKIAQRFLVWGLNGETVVLIGIVLGLVASFLAGLSLYIWALFFLLVNRAFGLIEKSLFQIDTTKERSFYLFILGDVFFWGSFVLAFAFSHSGATLVAAALMFSLMIYSTTSLAFVSSALRNELSHDESPPLARLVEETELSIAFVFMCIFPNYFSGIAILLTLTVLITAVSRTCVAWHKLR